MRHYSEEINHADGLIHFIQQRGGQVVLYDIEKPPNKWSDVENIVKTAFELEKDNYNALFKINNLANEHCDVSTSEFIESVYLTEQLKDQKDLADLLTKVKYALESKTIHLLDYNIEQAETEQSKYNSKMKT
ncbi:ferritin, middle subunit-like [Daktulosphaira vitifoliae]|uniref:ferritin, middle subunit-like n=1 Tax=Daktulosphaira vitifoliae TaxID=58002 RepID=UPI0021AA1D43|nr:ferritin, middle subunit-like [Daktulosphaira vitifoliae]